MNDYLDKYCERIAPGLWQEPLNFISNLAFFLVAFIIIRNFLFSRHTTFKSQWDIWLLVTLCVFIAIGSGLWHLFATRKFLWFDRIPILVFINVYLISCLRRVLILSWISILMLFIIYHIFNTTVQILSSPSTLNGSLFYVPTLIYLTGIAIFVYRQKSKMYQIYTLATLCFSSALILRTIDLEVCHQFPIGSHFLWHILIAITLFLLLKALILGQIVELTTND